MRTIRGGSGRDRATRPLLMVCLAALLLASVSACGGSPAPDARTLLRTARTKLEAAQYFHFVLRVDNPGQSSGSLFSVTAAEGDVQRPDRLRATANVGTPIGTLSVGLVIIGSNAWYTDPISGKYVSSNQFSSVGAIFDAQKGVTSLLGRLANPTTPSDGTANGRYCWKISGTIRSDDLQSLVVDTIKPGIQVPTTLCIGKDDGQLYSASLRGVIADGDTDRTVRTFFLSAFDKPVSITAPAA